MVKPSDSNKERDLDAVGFVTLGQEYANAARTLQNGNTSYGRSLIHLNPVGFLYCHAIELCLKGLFLAGQPEGSPKDFEHDLVRLYDAVDSCAIAGPVLQQVSNNVRARIKAELREGRNGLRSEWLDFSKEEMDELFRLPTDQEIEEALPNLRKEVVWLNRHHKGNGGKFRYPRIESNQIPVMRIGRIEEVRPFLTAHTACNDISETLRGMAS